MRLNRHCGNCFASRRTKRGSSATIALLGRGSSLQLCKGSMGLRPVTADSPSTRAAIPGFHLKEARSLALALAQGQRFPRQLINSICGDPSNGPEAHAPLVAASPPWGGKMPCFRELLERISRTFGASPRSPWFHRSFGTATPRGLPLRGLERKKAAPLAGSGLEISREPRAYDAEADISWRRRRRSRRPGKPTSFLRCSSQRRNVRHFKLLSKVIGFTCWKSGSE